MRSLQKGIYNRKSVIAICLLQDDIEYRKGSWRYLMALETYNESGLLTIDEHLALESLVVFF